VWIVFAMIAPTLAIAFFIVPLVYDAILSFQKVSILEAGHFGSWTGWSNYSNAFGGGLGHLLLNTALWQATVPAISKLCLGIALALVLRSRAIRTSWVRALGRTMLVLVWAVPPVAATALWRFMLSPNIGLVNELATATGLGSGKLDPLATVSGSWPAVIGLIVWNGLPFAVLVLLGAFESIPEELYEASALDGASHWQQTWKITLPLSIQTVGVLCFLMFVELFNNFVYVWLTTGGGPGYETQVLATAMYSAAFVNYNLGAGAAIGVVMSLMMGAVGVAYYALFSRRRTIHATR
jgi:multiple sugar transport system permease protein